MAAHARYPASHEQLFVLAVAARRDGLIFEEFWEAAVRPGRPPITWGTPEGKRPARCVIWPRDTNDRNVSIGAIRGSESAWRRAYEGIEATPSERALAILRPGLEALAEVAEERQRGELGRGLERGVAVASAA